MRHIRQQIGFQVFKKNNLCLYVLEEPEEVVKMIRVLLQQLVTRIIEEKEQSMIQCAAFSFIRVVVSQSRGCNAVRGSLAPLSGQFRDVHPYGL